jgi:hypothetical protein
VPETIDAAVAGAEEQEVGVAGVDGQSAGLAYRPAEPARSVNTSVGTKLPRLVLTSGNTVTFGRRSIRPSFVALPAA